MKIGFDNEKYLKMQSEHIRERINHFDNKLYLEFGGKLFDDYHASRVLPGFAPDSKLKLLMQLSDQAEIVIVISAGDIEKNKIRGDLGITYDSDVLRLMDSFKDPYLVLIACILSLRTNDRTTYPATLRMLELAKTPQEMMGVNEDDLAKAIYPVGFYKNKAGQIIELSKLIVEKYDGKVPNSIEELCKFRGVGRKTANLVMTLGFGEPAICVDVHVHRIFNRLGYIKTKNPEETEFALRENLPIEYWIPINTLLVTHGQNVCKPIKPMCSNCPVSDYCDKLI